MKVMANSYINKNTDGWGYDYFLRLDDKTRPNGQMQDCGKKCVRHELSITSEVTQNVWVSAHRWD